MDMLESASQKALTPKGRATRARIVESAAALIYERGVANTSTEDIRAATGVSNSQLYHYFADKDDLTQAVVAYQIDRVVARQEALLSGLDCFAALDAWGEAIVEIVAAHNGRGGCPLGSLASELADLDEDARVALDSGFARWEAAIRRGLAAMRDRGELRDDADPERLALAVLTVLQGGLLLSQTRRDGAPLEAGLEAAIGYLRTFAARPEKRRR